jgi:acyl carrier protein
MSVTSAPASLIMRVSLPLSKPYVPPNNELEALAATTFAEVFNLDKVGIDDEFFELGGDSLLAEVLSLALSERTNVPLQPSAFVESASPREIARLFNGTDVGPGWLDIARYANSQWAKAPILQAWRTVLRHLPEAPADGFADDRSKDLQVAPAPKGAQSGKVPIVFVFCGHGARFSLPLNIIHRWLASLGAHIVYLRDFRKLFYLSGIASLGSDYATSIKGLRKLSADLGASSIHCLGNSAGVFGAMQMGLDLEAQSVLCLAGTTGFTSRKRGSAFRRVAADLPRWSGVDPVMLDLRYRYESSPSYPRVRHVYGAAHDVDREEAERLAGLEGIELVPLPGWTEHLVIDALIESEEFVPALRWMFGAEAVSKNVAAPRTPIGKSGPLPVASATEERFRTVRKNWRQLRLLSLLNLSRKGKKKR